MKNMRFLVLFLVFLGIGVQFSVLHAQDKKDKGTKVLLTIGDKKITVDEFERIYSKNNNNITDNQQTPEEYLDLFVNFKLKVIEAENLGMDTTKKFLDEFNGYKDQLAKPYLTDEETKQKMIQEAWERMQYDVNVSHILIKVTSDASPEDTLEAYNKAMEARNRIINGEDFSEVAKELSEDPSVQNNGGDLGYFTVFRMVYPFECGAYNLEVGEVSMPVRTSFGYHILKLNDKRPAAGEVRVAHIFLRTPEGMSDEELASKSELAHNIQDSLKAGVEFAELASRYSDDRRSAANGGELGWFGTGRMIPMFENAAFSIENPGEYTEPFQSDYGWHIILLLDKKGIGTFEEVEKDLTSKALKGDREQARQKSYINKLKTKHGYQLNEEALKSIYPLIDSSYFTENWDPQVKDVNLKQTLITTNSKKITIGEFLDYLSNNKTKSKNTPAEILVNNKLDAYSEDLLMKIEKETLPDRYPEYKYILQEYHDGILLFDLMDKKVWTKAVEDTTGLEEFYEQNKDNYMWKERNEAIVVSADTSVDINALLANAKNIVSGVLTSEAINKQFCKDTVDCISLEDIKIEKGDNEKVDELWDQPGAVGDVYKENDRMKFVIVIGTLAPTIKELDETRGQVISDYQDQLEKEWIEELRAKYKIKVKNKLLSSISPNQN